MIIARYMMIMTEHARRENGATLIKSSCRGIVTLFRLIIIVVIIILSYWSSLWWSSYYLLDHCGDNRIILLIIIVVIIVLSSWSLWWSLYFLHHRKWHSHCLPNHNLDLFGVQSIIILWNHFSCNSALTMLHFQMLI